MTYPRSCNISMIVGRDYYFHSLQSISYFRLEYIFLDTGLSYVFAKEAEEDKIPPL